MNNYLINKDGISVLYFYEADSLKLDSCYISKIIRNFYHPHIQPNYMLMPKVRAWNTNTFHVNPFYLCFPFISVYIMLVVKFECLYD